MKRILALTALAVAVCALVAAPAFAEGYNNGGTNYTTAADAYDGTAADIADYGSSAGQYVRTPSTADQEASPSGPHGGYTTSTNKCQDCHSTHYAKGSYMLLRANSREDACEFCHGGGGGSTLNIQMDNAYDADGPVTGDNRGMGTGHTLGYEGSAPADIQPAYTQANGFACFDCHTPHGNSARVMTTFANPGRAYFEVAGQASSKVWVKNVAQTLSPSAAAGANYQADSLAVGATVTIGGLTYTVLDGTAYGIGNYFNLGAPAGSPSGGPLWGLAPIEGNINVRTTTTAAVKPVWPTGRFLLLKNPDVELRAGIEVSDMTTSSAGYGVTTVDADGDGAVDSPYQVADEGENKLAINWDNPLGPADAAYGGNQDLDKSSQTPVSFPGSPTGILSVSEMCTDCHDGSAGASQQPANVWLPSEVDSSTGDYTVAYSHDAQPRH